MSLQKSVRLVDARRQSACLIQARHENVILRRRALSPLREAELFLSSEAYPIVSEAFTAFDGDDELIANNATSFKKISRDDFVVAKLAGLVRHAGWLHPEGNASCASAPR